MKHFFWIFLVFLVVFRYLSSQPIYQNGDRIKIRTRITTEPLFFSDQQYLKFQDLKIYLPRYPEISYGDNVVIEGIVEDKHLVDAELKEIKKSKGFFGFRKKMINFYQTSLPEPHSSLIAGFVLGSKNMPTSFWENLKNTSTAHVVVASGTNVTLVAGFLLRYFVTFIKRNRALVLAIIGVWLYVALAGLEAPLIRAAIMATIAFTAQELGRLNLALRALFLTALIMLLINPFWISDLGFILSFTATLFLMLFSQKIVRKILFVPSIFREGLATSLAAQIGVAPIIYFTFGQFNLFSPIINALVLWIIGPTTAIAMLAGILSLFVVEIARLILFLVYPLTTWFIWVVNIFSAH